MQCDSCNNCYQQIDPIYDPFASSAFPLSRAHRNNSCRSISKPATIVDAFTRYATATDPRLLSFPPSVSAMDATGSGGIIIDAYSTLTILRTDIYNTTRNTFVKRMGRFPKAERGPFLIHATIFSDVATRKCWRSRFISLRGRSRRRIAWFESVRSGMSFIVLHPPMSMFLSIIGNMLLQGMRVAFNLENSVVRFTQNNVRRVD